MTASVWAVRDPKGAWKQLALVRDERIDWLELVPALWVGWNVKREWTQNGVDWAGHDAAAIVAYKRASGGLPFEAATEAETAFVMSRLEVL